MSTFTTTSEDETKKIAADIALNMPHGGFVCLKGDLGSGKTVFSKGFAEVLGIKQSEIKSPTYTLVREYKLKKGTLYHYDFYRIEALDELMETELREIFKKKNAWILIEWPERVTDVLPKKYTLVDFQYLDTSTRRLTVTT